MKNEQKHTPLFFIGGRSRGYVWVKEMINNKENLVGALIMQEDEHETEKYSSKIAKLLIIHSIPYLITKSAKKEEYYKFIKKLKPSLITVLGWRTLIPKRIIKLARYGTVAVHESLLPKYRGFAPVNWAVINGEKITGVSLFFLSEGMDNGDIIAQEKITISLNDTAWTVYKKTSKASIKLLNKYIPLLKNQNAPKKKQIENNATYACARIPTDGLINWSDSTEIVYNLIRGLSYPYPGAFTYYNDKKLIIDIASIPKKRIFVGRIPGRIVATSKNEGVEVLTGDGSILIKEIIQNGKRKCAGEVLTSVKATLGS